MWQSGEAHAAPGGERGPYRRGRCRAVRSAMPSLFRAQPLQAGVAGALGSCDRCRLPEIGMPAIRVRLTSVALTLLLLLATAAWPWGNEGHMAINRVAAERLPTEVPEFLRHAADQLAFLGPVRGRGKPVGQRHGVGI